ncbi:MAG TPA: hypothetical protein VLA34_04190 [Candidatus Krumholzibacterium sp.]|nr:hypothetical protein [Candidatus Krumholzibacterium sp.]
MKKTITGVLLATVAVFIWGALFWSSPFPFRVTSIPADDAQAGLVLKENFPETGVYMIPGQHNDRETLEKLYLSGPIAMVHIRHQGMSMNEPAYMLFGFLHILAFMILSAGLLRMVAGSLGSYAKRVRFTMMVGLTGTVFIELTNPVWWSHSWPWYLVTSFYFIICWAIAGLILGAFMGRGRSGA